MARSLYIPVHLHARLVRSGDPLVAVPTLDAPPSTEPNGAALEPGVHLHWALPDALTHGEVHGDPKRLRFPALPDIWIVVRFASTSTRAPAPGVVPGKRACTAFIVDAKRQESQPLGRLSRAPDRDARWLTVLGLLKDGEAPATGESDPVPLHLEAAYYPTARDRFGFHDDLADLVPLKAAVARGDAGINWDALHLTYAVIGYYTSPGEDPLARAGNDADRIAWIERARLRVDLPELRQKQPTPVHNDPLRSERSIAPELLLMFGPDNKVQALESSIIKSVIADGPTNARLVHILEDIKRLERSSRIGIKALESAGLKTSGAFGTVPEDSSGVPSRLVCHGAVVDVGPHGAFQQETPHAGAVDIAASASAAIEQAFLEMGGGEVFAIVRGGLDGESSATPGRQSLPHLLHGMGFDAAPPEPPDREYLAIVLDPDAAAVPVDPADPAIPRPMPTDPATPLRVVDRRSAPGSTPLPFGVTLGKLGDLTLSPAVVRIEVRQVPRPRWHRPATPVLALGGYGRSYRHGHDGRMQVDGLLQCRAGGETVRSLKHGSWYLGGDQLVDLGPALRSEPAFVRELLHEVALLDPSNAARAAAIWLSDDADTSIEDAMKFFCDATVGWWALADPTVVAQPDAVRLFKGTLPAPFAVTPWSDPWLPLFAEFKYTLTPDCTASAAGQSLGEVDLVVTGAAPASPISAVERQVLSSMLPGTVQSAIARLRKHFGTTPAFKATLDDLVRRLADLDIMTASLGELDPAVRAKYAFRSGSLAVTDLRLVDTFGTVRTVKFPGKRALQPRLTSWARIHTRLVAVDSDADADPVHSPLCGFLLFDAVEQALEVFGPAGTPLGQLRHDRDTGKSSWEPAPSRSRAELRDLKPPVLQEIVQAMLPAVVAPAPAPSALQAVLGVLDTARFSVARRLASDDYRAALCGRPVVVLRACLTLELAGVGAGDGPDGKASHVPDKIRVRLGCLDQLDDGLLGFFLKDEADEWRLHAVPHVASDAANSPYTVHHPLVRDDTSFELQPDVPRHVILLLDGLSAFHVQTGLLPRKRIEVSELIPARLVAQILPTLAVGPLLFDSASPRVPAPRLPGNVWSWVDVTASDFSTAPLAAFPPTLSEIPDAPPAVHHGWLRLDLEKD